MSFFGGNTSLGATSTPAKRESGGMFGSSFGATTATAAPAFGATTAAAPAFGATTGTAAPAFGATTGAAAPAFGSGLAAPAFGTTSSAFGAATTSAPTSTLGGGFGGFGAAAATSQPSLFSTPAISAAPPAFSGFGQLSTTSNAPASGFAGFGATTTTAPTFGGFGASQPSVFGGSTFGSTFGKPAAAPTFSRGFGNTNIMLDQQQQQPIPISADEAFAQSILNVSIFGDERDNIVAKWNYLQAMWGTGKLFYSQSAAPVDITQENYLCRFKAIGYSRMPGKDNKLGLVALNFDREYATIKAQQQQIIQTLHSLMGSKPNILVHIDVLKELENKKCQMVIFVEEKLQLTHGPNDSKRILATELSMYLNQATVKPQLTNLGINEVLALTLPDEDQFKEYLGNPPRSVDPRMWRQANLDNPDATQFIPVPMIGFSDLKWRLKCQEQETETHALYMKKVDGELQELRRRHASATAKILEHKRKLAEMSHRILRIVVKQECTRKVGSALTPEEEALRTKLQNMQAVVSAPTQFKGRLSELLSQIRMQRNQFASNGCNDYTVDKNAEDEMKTILTMQQRAMEFLKETVNKDLEALDIIIKGLPELQQT
ncbi:hypothetical protein KR093_004254 [Drosophila rubida]|uniref:Nucleoporin Nup54 n=1 Tax=Drosophila rubida TaxID=30044 RepID=A0AAD4PKK7_9MUSC|nr:hypothetical protein KR093_004254 [Drosophila rubida]